VFENVSTREEVYQYGIWTLIKGEIVRYPSVSLSPTLNGNVENGAIYKKEDPQT